MTGSALKTPLLRRCFPLLSTWLIPSVFSPNQKALHKLGCPIEICVSTLPPQHLLPPCVRAKLFQLCPTFCNPMDCNPPGSSVHGISQSRLPEWVAILFSRGSSRPRHRTWVTYTAGRFFTSEPPDKSPYLLTLLYYYYFLILSPCFIFLIFILYWNIVDPRWR